MEELEFRPVYQQISDLLKQKIIAGEYQANSMLPNEDELAKHFNVSEPTLRKSLEILRNQRLISKQNGRGTFVTYTSGDIHKLKRIGIAGICPSISSNTHQALLLAEIS